ncbi:zinc finger protein CONSTANS-LIKE 16-like isoform X2 [Tripterygium wilfordii]|uniref:zinc finger protein CONSTANS-LIKE 16-like isoform X2 n=1 Tax=Tripterygium wilfordii TaxID=458696 RepID=UPI0018F7EE73|nr:zinc finger protein CONSTANS-LIKE 16-like isoform X2 [Tripterygium wilfordii]
MYAETGLFFPYLQNFSPENQQLEEYCKSQKPNASLGNLLQTSTISEYDLGGEGDLFKAPEPIIEEPIIGVDPMTLAISMISFADDIILSQGLKVADIESIQSDQLLNDVFYGCSNDLMAKAAIESPLSEVLDIKIPIDHTSENQIQDNNWLPDLPFQKSVSSSCLTSMEWVQGAVVEPSYLDFPRVDLREVYGIRRAFSEGDIEPIIIGSCTAKDRREKLSRYRNKKTKRNFGRKIKYACRKALADSQPRVRGRFAKTEDSSDISKSNSF